MLHNGKKTYEYTDTVTIIINVVDGEGETEVPIQGREIGDYHTISSGWETRPEFENLYVSTTCMTGYWAITGSVHANADGVKTGVNGVYSMTVQYEYNEA